MAITTILQRPLDVTRTVYIMQLPPFKKTEYVCRVLTCRGPRNQGFLQPPTLPRHLVQQPGASRQAQADRWGRLAPQ